MMGGKGGGGKERRFQASWESRSSNQISMVDRALDKREYSMIIFLISDRNHMM